jgi:hypothetical protein
MMVCTKCGNYASHPFCGCPHCGGGVTVPGGAYNMWRSGPLMTPALRVEGVTAPEVVELDAAGDGRAVESRWHCKRCGKAALKQPDGMCWDCHDDALEPPDIATENHTELTCPWCGKPLTSCDCTPRRAMTDKTGQRIAAALEELVKVARPLCEPQLFTSREGT